MLPKAPPYHVGQEDGIAQNSDATLHSLMVLGPRDRFSLLGLDQVMAQAEDPLGDQKGHVLVLFLYQIYSLDFHYC